MHYRMANMTVATSLADVALLSSMAGWQHASSSVKWHYEYIQEAGQ